METTNGQRNTDEAMRNGSRLGVSVEVRRSRRPTIGPVCFAFVFVRFLVLVLYPEGRQSIWYRDRESERWLYRPGRCLWGSCWTVKGVIL